ncbi:MAG: hypothetical protein SGJ21_01695 [Alphaproteobacteria bacterium]|mgnify:CR=1 FL=1|nr:hypothetical protein [Alphaproteobacteria bacterium]
MIAGLGSLLVMSCLGCSGPGQEASVIQLAVGPVPDSQAFDSEGNDYDRNFADPAMSSFRLPLQVGNEFSPSNWSQPENAGRFKALDLSTPLPVRNLQGDAFSAEVSFGASAAQTGLGVDLQIAPRAQIERNRAGNNVARTGGEIRVGRNLDLSDRDQRGTNIKAPSWYLFVGADNEALVWNVADKNATDGVALRDQVTVGDLQAGVAWSSAFGGQMSLGVVEREMKYQGIANDRDVSTTDHFAAFSYTVKR